MSKITVCVVGLGHFGKEMALSLARAGAEVIAIDSKRESVDEIANEIASALVGNVTEMKTLREAIPQQVDCVVVGIGDNIEASILCTHYLRLMGIKRIIARASNEHHATILKEIGATDVIFTEKDMAIQMAKIILNPNLLSYVPLSAGYEVVEINCPKKFTVKSLLELELRKRYGLFVMAVRREGQKEIIFLPAADFVLQETDSIIIVGEREKIDKLR